ncbi:hypothetical protein Vi05172_g6837 [Venturia inaequalis]|nr:hypothetical protein Vi05172_g6837 [Venturia inaequalis]
MPPLEDASAETKLENSITIYGDPEVVLKIAEVIHEFPEL